MIDTKGTENLVMLGVFGIIVVIQSILVRYLDMRDDECMVFPYVHKNKLEIGGVF